MKEGWESRSVPVVGLRKQSSRWKTETISLSPPGPPATSVHTQKKTAAITFGNLVWPSSSRRPMPYPHTMSTMRPRTKAILRSFSGVPNKTDWRLGVRAKKVTRREGEKERRMKWVFEGSFCLKGLTPTASSRPPHTFADMGIVAFSFCGVSFSSSLLCVPYPLLPPFPWLSPCEEPPYIVDTYLSFLRSHLDPWAPLSPGTGVGIPSQKGRP
ncbi:hypothetical protein LZ30DRAFT_99206 [Colletotrichum cereale]|nr:hypothetical protein LZ30DRAFT_99206 [Colletotrichum cereale]